MIGWQFDASASRFPTRGNNNKYTKLYVFQLYNQQEPKDLFHPTAPICLKSKNNPIPCADKIAARHNIHIGRIMFCQICGDINESMTHWPKWGLNCFCCGALYCAICVTELYPSEWGTDVKDIYQLDTDARLGQFMCCICRALYAQNSNNNNNTKSINV